MGYQQALENIIHNCTEKPDLSNDEQLIRVLSFADQLLVFDLDADDLKIAEHQLITENAPLLARLAVKLAVSKSIVKGINRQIKVTIIFALYKEHHRILSQKEHKHGENFLLHKVRQLNWLFNQSHVRWDMLLVDDGCPEGSGRIAQEIIKTNKLQDQVKVLFLEDAIRSGLDVVAPLKSCKESQKGGSILYGMWYANEHCDVKPEDHIILYTDADLSTHLGQAGLLIEPIVNGDTICTLGSRREYNSGVIKTEKRNYEGRLFIFLWKKIITPLHYITDTQCGFKAFRGDIVPQIIFNSLEKQFAFDMEILLRTELLQPGSIVKSGIIWIDSAEETTTSDTDRYLYMLKAIVKMYEQYLPKNPVSDSFSQLISIIERDDWDILIKAIPIEITKGDAVSFGHLQSITARYFRHVLETKGYPNYQIFQAKH